MKRIVLMISAAVMLPVFVSYAQNLQRPKPPAGGGLPPQAGKQNAELKTELKADLEAEPAGEPVAELNVEEFQLKRNDLKGKVVELTFDRVVSLKQAGQEGYIAAVTYESPRIGEGLGIIIPDEGLEFFEQASKVNYPRKGTVYIQVVTPSMVKALGTRYSKNKPEGERYSW